MNLRAALCRTALTCLPYYYKLTPVLAGLPSIVQDNRSTTFHQIPGTLYHFTPATLGITYHILGKVDKAIEHYIQSLAIQQEIGDQREERTISWYLGLIYEEQGNLLRAVELVQVCVDYERAIGHPEVEKHAARVEEIRHRMAGG